MITHNPLYWSDDVSIREQQAQELQMWRDFEKWLKEVAFGEEQYKVLLAEFCKDYSKGITLEGDTYTVGDNERDTEVTE